MNRFIVRPLADADIDELADYIAEDNPEIGLLFYDAAYEAFERLAAMPFMGQIAGFRRPRNRELRYWPIPGFEKRLIFYRPIPDGVEIVRVLHSARHILRILGEKLR